MPRLTRRNGKWTEAYDREPDECDHPDGHKSTDDNCLVCPHCGHVRLHESDP